MSNLVFVSGTFSSGTTLLFTLFRQTPGCFALFEPLHERLAEYLLWSPRVYEGHAFVGNYYAEFKGFSSIPALHDPAWGVSGLHLSPDAPADDLYRYLSYVIGSAYARAPRVVLKENRFAFRLGWLRANFPNATIIHIYRDRDEQWRSMVRRVQEHLGREDVGQDSVDFMGFRIAAWCDDLAPYHAELAADHSTSGYERFSKLWDLSIREHERYADLSVGLAEIKSSFDDACMRISDTVGFRLDPDQLRPYVAPSTRRQPTAGPRLRLGRLLDRAGGRYAHVRMKARTRARSPE